MNPSKRICWLGLLVGISFTARLWSQVPAAPAVPGTVAAPAPAKNLWSFLALTPEQRANLRARWCASPIGQLASSSLRPVTMMTGGLIQGRCGMPGPADLAKPADSSEGAAARAKKDEMEANARRNAVRYLGTMDCTHFPEARDGLIKALRGDSNECVRLEAALALQRGCCCVPETIKALAMCISGLSEDGFPPENSERVKAAAAQALSLCVVELPRLPEVEPAKEKTKTTSSVYYRQVASLPRDKVLLEAKKALAQHPANAAPAAAPGSPAAPVAAASSRKCSEGVFGIVGHAFSASAPSSETATPPATQAPNETGPRPPIAAAPAVPTRQGVFNILFPGPTTARSTPAPAGITPPPPVNTVGPHRTPQPPPGNSPPANIAFPNGVPTAIPANSNGDPSAIPNGVPTGNPEPPPYSTSNPNNVTPTPVGSGPLVLPSAQPQQPVPAIPTSQNQNWRPGNLQ